MKHWWLVVVSLVVLLSACGSNDGMQHGSGMPVGNMPVLTVGTLEIYAPRAMAGAKGQTTGGFLTLKNTGAAAERLLGAWCDAATMTQVHETVMDGDVMRMREVESIEVPAGGMVELKHGGYHIMLMDLKQDLKAGESTLCTLKFESAGEVTVSFVVMSR